MNSFFLLHFHFSVPFIEYTPLKSKENLEWNSIKYITIFIDDDDDVCVYIWTFTHC